jgi:hypothetical protein
MRILDYEIGSRKIAFILIFSALGLLLSQFNFSPIVGALLEEKPYFTMFQLFGPMAGGILGPLGGIAMVVMVAATNFILTGKALSIPIVVSAATMSFAAIYFGSKRKEIAAVPIICMALFWLHPEGAAAWFYPLFWLIPLAAVFYRQNLFIRSLGATFTAHAIGSVAWAYAFNIPAATYLPLMVIVPVERLIFAIGITVSYYAVTTVLEKLSSKINLSSLNIERKYALVRA